ncbi:MAG: hypothetical protein U0350_26565 [Caldilineaceae bacterium]
MTQLAREALGSSSAHRPGRGDVQLPGIATFAFSAIAGKDYFVIQGIVLMLILALATPPSLSLISFIRCWTREFGISNLRRRSDK